MNDEIKEIIEYFKDDIDYLEEELKYPNFKGRYITIRDKECEYLRKLLDYITNLQQINKNLTNSLNKKVEEGIKLQLENERLKETVENLTTMTVCGDRKQIKNTAQYKLDICKSKIDKAIEYIKTHTYDDSIDEDGTRLMFEKANGYNLLNILQGVDKE